MKLSIGVFFGGRSVEHEVSIISAIQAINAIDREKYDVLPVYISRNNDFYIGEDIGRVEEYRQTDALLARSQRVLPVPENGKLLLLRHPAKKFGNNYLGSIDVALPIVHGTNVEDGALQGFFKTLGVPFAGCDVLSSALGMDKFIMKTVLKYYGLPVLDCVRADVKRYSRDPGAQLDLMEQRLKYPLIVKPVNLGSSVGIKLAHDRGELSDAMDYAFDFASAVLVEHAVQNLREINCSVFGDYEEAVASECEEPLSSGELLSYDDKYLASGASKGMTSLKRILPAQIPAETRKKVRALAVETFQALGCSGVARVDFLMDDRSGELWVNEINTIPGSLSFYLWEPVGVKYPVLLDKLISLALKREREASEINYSFDTNILAGFSGGSKGKL